MKVAQNSFSYERGLERNMRVLAREQKGARDLKPDNQTNMAARGIFFCVALL